MHTQPRAPAGWPDDCPVPPRSIADLPFTREPMVDWLAPEQLASTGLQAVLSSIFGSYADKREVQAALNPGVLTGAALYDRDFNSQPGEFWLDYCADVGDGFQPTYAMAWLMSRTSLQVPDEERLQRGKVLVLGGDQVYPTAKRDEYDNRFVGPYTAALPWVQEPHNPEMFAIPGNHDWYDGLTSFLRLFCQRRWIGGWKTSQRRSYFALRLPNNWWIWGTDLQLGSDVDEPQRQYFKNVARQMNSDAGGQARLVLCTAQPSWVFCDELDDEASVPPRRGCRHAVDARAFASLDFLCREAIERNQIDLAAILSGDLHHYTHYQENGAGERGLHLITSGGGGAYLYPTHHMPERLAIKVKRDQDVVRNFERTAAFPDEKDSRRLGRWSWISLPWRNVRFSLLVAGLYLLYAWMIQSASKRGTTLFRWFSNDAPTSLMELLRDIDVTRMGDAVRAYWDVLRHSPANVLFGLVLVTGLWAFRKSEERTRFKGISGIVHGVMHLLLCFALIWAFSGLNLTHLGMNVDSLWQVLLFTLEMFVAGGLLGGWLFGVYLVLASRLTGAHINEVFSSQSLTSFKNFLRLQFGADGSLTIHTIGVRATPEPDAYTYRPETVNPGDSWFTPPNDAIPWQRIERITIRGRRA